MSQHDTLTLEPTRAAFERYFLESRKSKGANRKPTFERFEDGTYKDDHTQRHWWTWQNAIATPAQAQQSEPAKPLFASKVSARKWAELQDDGARMQSIAFDGHKSGQPGTIDPWGVVLWDQAQQAGEPVAWRWRNCVGGWVTGWLDYKPSQRACIEQQVNEAGGIIQYAYATNPPAPAQPVQQMLEGWKLVDNKDGSITVSTPAGGVVTLWRKGQGSTEFIAYRLAQMLLTASPTPPAQPAVAQGAGEVVAGIISEWRDVILNARHNMDGVLDNDQINEVLNVWDDMAIEVERAIGEAGPSNAQAQLRAVEKLIDGSQPIDIPGALAVIRHAR